MGSPTQMILCPYCGSLSTMAKQCNICSGYFDLLSRQRSQNAMGPWFVRDLSKPFQPGCSYATLVRMAQRGKIKPDSVLRGPSTRQFWSFARQTPGVAHLLGECHSCHQQVLPTSNACTNCRASFLVSDDRQLLGLSPVHLLPGDADTATIARSLSGSQVPIPPRPAEPIQNSVPPPAPEPIRPSPLPEPQVVVEEPEWIEEEEAPEHASNRLGVFIALFVVVVMMSGAGVWAWLHLTTRGESAPAQTQAPDGVASTGDRAAIDVKQAEPLAPEPDTSEEVSPPEAATTDADSAPPRASTDQTSALSQDPQRLAYDRILIGIAQGTLDESEFEARLESVRSDLRDALRQSWLQRAQQIRLGRDGD